MVRYRSATHKQLDQLVLEGKAMIVATPTFIQQTAAPTLIQPGVGQVAIVTKIVSTGYYSRATSPGQGEVGQTHGLTLVDHSGNVQGNATFIAFMRVNALHEGTATPSWRSAVPCAPIVWEPEAPLMVPPGWALIPSTIGSATGDPAPDLGGCNFVCYGYMTDVATARALGYYAHEYNPSSSSPSALNIREGFIGATFTGSAVEILAGRTGQSIQIIDVVVRHQQLDHVPTHTWTIRQTDDRIIFKGANNNPSDFAEFKMSPGIYLKSGQGIEIIGATGIRASVAITYRFVNDEEVPSDCWWAYAEPQLATPASGTTGTLSLATTATTTMSVYYPGLDSSRTDPDVGRQHVVEGYCISVQKDLTATPDVMLFAVTTGTAGGSVGLGDTLEPTTTNDLISPIISSSSHDQCTFLAVDGLNVPCRKDTGLIFVDSSATGSGVGTPAAADLDVDEWHVTVWGRTIATRHNSAVHFMGT